MLGDVAARSLPPSSSPPPPPPPPPPSSPSTSGAGEQAATFPSSSSNLSYPAAAAAAAGRVVDLEHQAEEVRFVREKEVPPIAASGWTVVYVLRWSNGWCYCGETDNLEARLKTHRANAKSSGAAHVEAAYVRVRSGGKSTARMLEAMAITALRAAGIPLTSDVDARHRSFGSSM